MSASLLFSLAPAVQFWRPNLAPALKQQVIAGGGPLRFRRIAVGVQIGLSLLLLVGAGLFTRTLQNLKSVDVGFATDHLVTFTINPSLAGYPPTQDLEVDSRVLSTLAALPGVRSVAATTDPELADNDRTNNITLAGYTAKEDEDMNVEHPRVSPGYFASMGMQLLAGRELSDADREGTEKVAVVNESFARHFFGDPQNALGSLLWQRRRRRENRHQRLSASSKMQSIPGVREEIRRTVFSPYLQETDPGGMAFYIRTWQTPESAEATIRSAMQALDSKLVLDTFRTMDEQIDDNLTAERVVAFLAASFGVLAALMAAIGLYGVLAYSTAQRTSEIGIRMALGASRASVIRVVLVEVLWLTGIAIAVALPTSLLLGMAVRSQLFGISSGDPLTLCLATLVILVVAIASALLPGATRRQGRSHHGVALRIKNHFDLAESETQMIQLKNFERSYKTAAGQTWVLRRVNLEIREGEFITIMGPSGAGNRRCSMCSRCSMTNGKASTGSASRPCTR